MGAALSLGMASGRTALQVAGFMSRPAAALAPAARDRWLADVGGRDLRPMLDAKAARRAVEAYLASVTGAATLSVDAAFLNGLAARASAVAAIDIALAPFDRLDRLKAFVIGAICRDQVRGALLKADRQVIEALLGAEVQDFAARQAATFYPALAGLAPSIGPALRGADGTSFSTHPVNALAGRVISAAIGAETPLAAAILAIREHGQPDIGTAVPLTQAQCAEVLRLWQREARR